MSRGWRIAAVALAGVVLMLLMVCSGNAAPLDFFFTFVFGWVRYVWRVLPQVKVNWAGVALAGICVVLIALIGHGLCSWLWRGSGHSSRWRWRWSAAGLAVLMLMFAAGTAAVGVAHQSAWLARSPGPLFENRTGLRADRVHCASNLRQLHAAIMLYAQDHGGEYPQRLEQLVDAGLIEHSELFVCPASAHERAPGATTREWAGRLRHGHHLSYVYLPDAFQSTATRENGSGEPADRRIVLYEALENHEGRGINVCNIDGSVEFLDAQQAERFLKARQRVERTGP